MTQLDAPRARWDRGAWGVLLITCVGQFVTQLDLTVVTVATGAIGRDLHSSTATVTWVVDGYVVTFAAFMIGMGELGDRIGRRRVFVAGLAAFALTSAGCAGAPGVRLLIAFRALQGIAGAAVLVSSLALLSHAFGREDRARAVGLWSAVAGTALVFGPLCGGLLVDGPGWRSVFWINVPVCAASAVAGRFLLADSRSAHRRPLDPAGQLVAVTALGALGVGLSWTAASRGSSAGGWATVLAGAAGIGAFIVLERRATSPLIPPDLLDDRAGRAANAAALVVNFSTVGLLFLLSLYLEQARGRSPTAAGVTIAPLFIAYALVSLLSGRLVERFGPRTPARGGAALAGVAVLAATVLGADGPALIPMLAAAGAGVGLAMPALVATAVEAAPAERIGLASGLNNTARQVGGALGVALLGGIVAGSHSVAAGTRVGLAVAAAAYLLAALVCGALPGRPGQDRFSRTTTRETPHAPEHRPSLLSGRAAVTAGELDAGPHPTPTRSRPTGLDLLGPEAPDISLIDSVAAGREIIDELDDLIRDVIMMRRQVAWRIQKLRMTAGGGRIEMSREYEVTRRFLDALGPAGSEVAVALLLLCRGPAPPVDVQPSTDQDIDSPVSGPAL